MTPIRVLANITDKCQFEKGSADNVATVEILAYPKDETDALIKSKDAVIKSLQDVAKIKDACIIKLNEKIRNLESKIWELQKIPYTDNSAVISRLTEENEQLKKIVKNFQKRYND